MKIVFLIFSLAIFLFSKDIKLEDGSIYDGELRYGKPFGYGKLVYPNKTTYEGNFNKGKYDGDGVLVFSDQSSYKGSFKDGLYEGKGVLEIKNGYIYTGEFIKGKKTDRKSVV